MRRKSLGARAVEAALGRGKGQGKGKGRGQGKGAGGAPRRPGLSHSALARAARAGASAAGGGAAAAGARGPKGEIGPGVPRGGVAPPLPPQKSPLKSPVACGRAEEPWSPGSASGSRERGGRSASGGRAGSPTPPASQGPLAGAPTSPFRPRPTGRTASTARTPPPTDTPAFSLPGTPGWKRLKKRPRSPEAAVAAGAVEAYERRHASLTPPPASAPQRRLAPGLSPPGGPARTAPLAQQGSFAFRVPAAAAAAEAGSGAVRRGMHNPGNMCYINAAVSMLLSLPSLRADLHALRALPRGAGPLAEELLGLSRQFEGGAGLGPGSPSELKRLVDARAGHFHGNSQQDAHEFICVLLQALQEEVVAAEGPADKPASTASAEGGAAPPQRRVKLERTADPAARNFAGTLEREMECKACGCCTSKQELFMHLSLDVPPLPGPRGAAALPELLSAFFCEENLEKDCAECGARNTPHAVRLRIKRMPRVLVLHLKRFQMGPKGQPQKISTPVNLSHVLDVGEFCSQGAFLPPPLAEASVAPGSATSTSPAAGRCGGSLMRRFSNAAETPAKKGHAREDGAPPASAGQTPRPVTPFPGGAEAAGAVSPVELVDGGTGPRASAGFPSAHRYFMSGLVSHLGVSGIAAAGHFITDVADRVTGGRWTRHDDSRVYPIEPRDLSTRTSDCYVLAFVHASALCP